MIRAMHSINDNIISDIIEQAMTTIELKQVFTADSLVNHFEILFEKINDAMFKGVEVAKDESSSSSDDEEEDKKMFKAYRPMII